jgi:hypothetical protein
MAEYGMTNLDFHNLTLQEAAQVIVEIFGAVSPSLGELNKTEMERELELFTLGHVSSITSWNDRLQIRAEYREDGFHLYGTWKTPTIAHLDATWAAYRGMMGRMKRMGMRNTARGIDRKGEHWKSELTTLDRVIIL